MTLKEVAQELSRRLGKTFLPDETGRRPCHGDDRRYAEDPNYKDLILFYEYFHGDNGRGVGASHQTGWTALVASLLRDLGQSTEKARVDTISKRFGAPPPPPVVAAAAAAAGNGSGGGDGPASEKRKGQTVG